MGNKIINAIWSFIKLIFKVIGFIFNSLKYILRIPITSLIAMIFGFAAILLIRTIYIPLDIVSESLFNYDLSRNLNYAVIDSLIVAIIYIILNIILFNDSLKNDSQFKPRRALLYYVPTIILWMIPLLFMEDLISDTLLGLVRQKFDFFEPVYSFILIAFTGPHLWFGLIIDQTKGVLIGLAINSFIYVIYSYIVTQKLGY